MNREKAMLNWVPEKRALCPAALMGQLLAISSQESHWRGCSDSRLPLLESWGGVPCLGGGNGSSGWTWQDAHQSISWAAMWFWLQGLRRMTEEPLKGHVLGKGRGSQGAVQQKWPRISEPKLWGKQRQRTGRFWHAPCALGCGRYDLHRIMNGK